MLRSSGTVRLMTMKSSISEAAVLALADVVAAGLATLSSDVGNARLMLGTQPWDRLQGAGRGGVGLRRDRLPVREPVARSEAKRHGELPAPCGGLRSAGLCGVGDQETVRASRSHRSRARTSTSRPWRIRRDSMCGQGLRELRGSRA